MRRCGKKLLDGEGAQRVNGLLRECCFHNRDAGNFMTRALAFDLDDTLYDESQFVVGGIQAVSRFVSYQFEIAEEQALSMFISILRTSGRKAILEELVCRYGL